MLISPALLDFLEQAIEPIPVVMPLAGSGVGIGIGKASKTGGQSLSYCISDLAATKQ